MIDWKSINAALRKPFPKELEKSRPGGRTTLTYIDTRDVFDRLDDVVGPENWGDDFQLWDAETGCVKCTITIHGISRSDVGYPNGPMGATNSQGKRSGSGEPLKDACTDAFKRASVHWGIGRYLYQDHPPTLRSSEEADKPEPKKDEYLSFDAPTHGTPSLEKLHAVAESKPAGHITEAQITSIKRLCDITGSVLPHDLNEWSAAKGAEGINRLNRLATEQRAGRR